MQSTTSEHDDQVKGFSNEQPMVHRGWCCHCCGGEDHMCATATSKPENIPMMSDIPVMLPVRVPKLTPAIACQGDALTMGF